MSILEFAVYRREFIIGEPVKDTRLGDFGLDVLEGQALGFEGRQLGILCRRMN